MLFISAVSLSRVTFRFTTRDTISGHGVLFVTGLQILGKVNKQFKLHQEMKLYVLFFVTLSFSLLITEFRTLFDLYVFVVVFLNPFNYTASCSCLIIYLQLTVCRCCFISFVVFNFFN